MCHVQQTCVMCNKDVGAERMYMFGVHRHLMCNKDVGEDVRKGCIWSNGVKKTGVYIYTHMCMYTVMSKDNIYTNVYIYSHVQRKYVDDSGLDDVEEDSGLDDVLFTRG